MVYVLCFVGWNYLPVTINLMAYNNSILENRNKIIKTLDNVKGSIDAWSFKNLFFTFLFIKKTKPKEFHEFVIKDLKKLEQEIHHAKDQIKAFIRKSDPDKHGLEELASIDEIFKGLTDEEAGDKLIYVMREMNNMDLTKEQDFGDFYEFLIDEFGQRAGKSGGEFYTPKCLRDLIAGLVKYDFTGKLLVSRTRLKTDEELDKLYGDNKNMREFCKFHSFVTDGLKIYDPTCGVGSLLLEFKGERFKLYGQEINRKSYEFAKFNMLAHGVNDFNIAHGDTLINDHFKDEYFDIVVANYPYGIR